MRASLYRRGLKRAFDAAASAAALAALSPLLLAIAAAVKLQDGGPVLFRQVRAGKGGRPFEILKFRTMRPGGGGPLVTSGADARVTPLGRVLRRAKLDELPQLVNVLRGEMSVVGPRPEVPRYVALFQADYDHILSVRPGLTDWAAVKYRDEEEVLAGFSDPEKGYVTQVLPDKIALYRRYVDEAGFGADLRIILATAARIAGG